MTEIDLNADQLISDMDDLRLTWLEGARAEYEAKRDYFQLLMDTTDKMIHEIHQKKVGKESNV